jgi:serine/threonine-protein kinase
MTASATPAPAACADFVKDLLKCHLIREEDLPKVQAYVRAFPDRGRQEVADFMVGQGVLTRFQADLILDGRAGELLLSQFVLTDVLGSGSMGTVYRARMTNAAGAYAVKIIPRRNVASLNTVAEKVKALREVRHPRVSALIHLGASGERVYLAWPFLEGGEKLDAMVQRQGKLTPRQTVQVAVQIASGLQAYHQHGLYHGLLKPTDVLIGTDRRVRILDFGVGFLLASERGKSLLDTMTNTKALTRGVDCASPESLLNPLDRTPKGDQYSLGCILYFCLTGQYPFPMSNPVKKMMAHQFDEPTPLRELCPEAPPKVAAIVERLMEKKPEDRYENTDDLVAALQALNPSAPKPAARPAMPATPVMPPAAVKTAPRIPAVAVRPQPAPAKKKEAPAARPAVWRDPRLVLAGVAVACVAAGGLVGWLLALP